MEPVEIYIKREVFDRQAIACIGVSLVTMLPLLYVYLLLGTIDFFHPAQFVYDFFGGLIPVILYWLICAVVIFIALAYRTTHYKVVNEKLCSPVDSLSVVCNKKSLCQMAAHFVASLLVSCVLTSLIGGRYGDMIVSCDGIGNNRCLNEHKWFVVLFSAVTGLVFIAEANALGRLTLQFPETEKPVMKRLKEELPTLLKTATRGTRRAFLVYYPLYFIIGGFTAHTVRSLLFLHDSKNVGLKSFWDALDLTLLYQTYVAGVFVRLSWEISLHLFQSFMTKHVKFELNDSRGDKSMLAAIELKQDNLTKMLGYKDLASMAQTVGDSRRSAVYNLSLPGGHPKSWNSVVSATSSTLAELLNRIQNHNDQLVSEYKGILSHQATKIETLKPGYSSAKPTSPSKVAKGKPWYHPSILHKAHADHLSAEIFYDTQKHLWALSALTSLIIRSFSEDKYGIVQQNLGETITLIIKLQQATENLFRAAPILKRKPDERDINRHCNELGRQLRKQLTTSLQSIAITFHPHINHIVGMSTEHMKQLEELVH